MEKHLGALCGFIVGIVGGFIFGGALGCGIGLTLFPEQSVFAFLVALGIGIPTMLAIIIAGIYLGSKFD